MTESIKLITFMMMFVKFCSLTEIFISITALIMLTQIRHLKVQIRFWRTNLSHSSVSFLI